MAGAALLNSGVLTSATAGEPPYFWDNHAQMLSNGTLIVVQESSANNLRLQVSTDDGATWNPTNEIAAGHTVNQSLRLAVDEFDNIFIITVASASTIRWHACTLSGLTLTRDAFHSEAISGQAYGNAVAFDNPTRSGDHTHVMCLERRAPSTNFAFLMRIDYDRSAKTFGSFNNAGFGTSAGWPGLTKPAQIILVSSEDDYRIPRNPGSPQAMVVIPVSTTSDYFTPFTWDATNHRMLVGTQVTKSWGFSSDMRHTAYNPTTDTFQSVLSQDGNSNFVVYESTFAALSTWNLIDTVSFGSTDADFNDTVHLGILPLGVREVTYVSALNATATTWRHTDLAAGAFGAREDLGSRAGPNLMYYMAAASCWVPGRGFICTFAVPSGNLWNMVFSVYSLGGAFTGWGIPMGIS